MTTLHAWGTARVDNPSRNGFNWDWSGAWSITARMSWSRSWDRIDGFMRRAAVGEGSGERRAAMTARAKGDALIRIADVRLALEIVALEASDIDEQLARRRLSGQGG